jgi:hypothetical protein
MDAVSGTRDPHGNKVKFPADRHIAKLEMKFLQIENEKMK